MLYSLYLVLLRNPSSLEITSDFRNCCLKNNLLSSKDECPCLHEFPTNIVFVDGRTNNRSLSQDVVVVVAESSCEEECLCENNQCAACNATGYNGSVCERSCSVGCLYGLCNARTGVCYRNKCKENFLSTNCSKCKPGKFGEYCQDDCLSHCSVCSSNFSCEFCEPGYSGSICERRCPEGCLGDLCKENRTCYKCKPNRVGNFCEDCISGKLCNEDCPPNCLICSSYNSCNECKLGYHGESCQLKCSHGCFKNKCYQGNGTCYYGCKSEFKGEFCQECFKGRYGTNCSGSCLSTCKENVCEQTTGHCLNGCNLTMYGPTCEYNCPQNCETCSSNISCHTCSTGLWGDMCNLKCSEGCLGSCFQNGTCRNCKEGYYGSFCNLACPTSCTDLRCTAGFSENRCEHNCSLHCCNGTCNRYGTCEACDSEFDDATGDSPQIGVLVAAVVVVVVAIPVVAIRVVIVIKRKKSGRRATLNEEMVTYSQMDMVNTDAVQQEGIPTVYASSLSRESTGNKPVPTVSAWKETVNVDATCDLRNENISGVNEEEEKGDNMLTMAEPSSYVYTNVLEVKQRRVPLEQLRDYVTNKTTGEMTKEFESLPGGLIHTFSVSQTDENKTKNRYKDLYPYDKNRIILTDRNAYINASYIDGHKKRKAYIACQGPTEKHMDNFAPFWEMVWQENVNMIVMLTNLFENGLPKCDKYWPDSGATEQYGEIRVLGLKEDIMEEYIVRTFSVKRQRDSRVIRQLQFTMWPDKGVPARVSSIVHFQREVRRLETPDSPLVVHCSAGIGRTGTFIALDILTKEGMTKGYVDIYACVRNLREERVNMIQTLEQYYFLHEAVVECLLSDRNKPSQQEVVYSNFDAIMFHTDT